MFAFDFSQLSFELGNLAFEIPNVVLVSFDHRAQLAKQPWKFSTLADGIIFGELIANSLY